MSPDVAEFVQYGVLGLVLLAIIVGWLTPGRQTDREAARGDRLELELKALRDRLEGEVIPLLAKAILALEEAERRRATDGGPR